MGFCRDPGHPLRLSPHSTRSEMARVVAFTRCKTKPTKPRNHSPSHLGFPSPKQKQDVSRVPGTETMSIAPAMLENMRVQCTWGGVPDAHRETPKTMRIP